MLSNKKKSIYDAITASTFISATLHVVGLHKYASLRPVCINIFQMKRLKHRMLNDYYGSIRILVTNARCGFSSVGQRVITMIDCS